jgi:flagellar biogenesis protein FliO
MNGFALLGALKDAAMRLVTGCASKAATQRHMRIEERLSLGPKKALLYVTCDGSRFLIAAGAEEIAGMIPLDLPRAAADVGDPLAKPRPSAAAGRKQVQ